MRSSSPRTSEHRCASYTGDADRLGWARGWFEPALARGRERILYMSAGATDPIARWLREMGREDVSVLDAAAVYGVTQLGDREAIGGWFAQFASDARDEGYEGLRAAADLTAFAGDENVAPLVRYELSIDAQMEDLGLFGTCLYDAAHVGEHLPVLERLHDHGRADPWGVVLRGQRLHLAGELDQFEALASLSAILGSLDDLNAVDIDLDDLRFIDAGTARVIRDYVVHSRARGVAVRLQGGSRITRKVFEVFGLTVE